ncbi:hypothetical protein P3X46_023410 [Hevea brasiliensis]|uniref:Alliinase C-terminal domain-containing protein n=2 Tax=Hevea brasiliensis TaxID=3981 RepID=A0ABQ9LAV0_HEVBR|nr:tryptophan aminotransferase-related protein 2 isoform X1 [Hevea brasiliensis]XP_057988532.1 tryptophan aminotransferase-related protein 2 isoform X1 [Hevea brasiliensis]KAJ9163778.1 hypothetical protein P3X46_023410 [Hevea brasiliensis]
MARFWNVFTLRNLLVLSLAINVSFMLRLVYVTVDIKREHMMAVDRSQREALPMQGAYLSVSSATSSPSSATFPDGDRDRAINLDHGDPTMYERFWQQEGDKATIVIPGWQSMSYFSDIGNLCWFLEPEFARQVLRLHKIVGNAVTENRHIVVGTGSTQLFQAVLYALASQDSEEPVSVVSAAPYYSSYQAITECLKSGLYKWEGDARSFAKEGRFIELVTSPNNPDGFLRDSVLNRSGGVLVHDFAYYWPQYTPITSPADYDIMLFTVSKTTGHAGMRIGWALVKDREIAKRIVKYIELNSIGVSKDSQLRAAKVLKVVCDSCESSSNTTESLFEFAYQLMVERWQNLRVAVKHSGMFSLPEFSPGFCKFTGRIFEPLPAFAWLKCEEPIEDCESFLRSNKILTRGGRHFGVGPQYVRISLLDRDDNFDLFVERLSSIRKDNLYQHMGE